MIESTDYLARKIGRIDALLFFALWSGVGLASASHAEGAEALRGGAPLRMSYHRNASPQEVGIREDSHESVTSPAWRAFTVWLLLDTMLFSTGLFLSCLVQYNAPVLSSIRHQFFQFLLVGIAKPRNDAIKRG